MEQDVAGALDGSFCKIQIKQILAPVPHHGRQPPVLTHYRAAAKTMAPPVPDYSGFPVLQTIVLYDRANIRRFVDEMVDAYKLHEPTGDFGYRILLPRGDEKVASKAKKLGFAFQGEFVLGLRKRHLVPRVRDVRYVHDPEHYGWILASPELYDRFVGAGG